MKTIKCAVTSVILATVAMMMISGPAYALQNHEVSQEELNEFREQLVDAYNSLRGMSDQRFFKGVETFLKTAEENDPIMAEKIETLLESKASKQDILANYKERMDKLSNNGIFLVGVAICHVIANVDGGWCFQMSNPFRNGYLPPWAFILLSVLTLGDEESGDDL